MRRPICCQTESVIEGGHYYCSMCGRAMGVVLETSQTCFSQSIHFVSPGYTRKTRFVKKVLGSLRMLTSHNVDEDLMFYLKTRKIETPRDLIENIALYPTKGRRPYQYAMFYWKSLGKRVPQVTDADIRLLTYEFDEIAFAWDRLKLQRPKFPYAFLFSKLVLSSKRYSEGCRSLVPFMRELRCHKRKKRYETLFLKCYRFNYKNLYMDMEEKIDECEEPVESIVTREVVKHPKTLSPYDCFGV